MWFTGDFEKDQLQTSVNGRSDYRVLVQRRPNDGQVRWRTTRRGDTDRRRLRS